MITNPIIPGMAPDPSIIRVENKYYIATSTFHWQPAIQLFESMDLANWDLVGYALDKGQVNLQGINTPAGVWAPHLSYDHHTKKYWILYSNMVNMGGREFNANNYAIWSYDIKGPWSEPIYITSIGFDPALFHDTDGKKYISILEWESREGYPSPGTIVIAEIDIETGELLTEWKRVTNGFTTRGCCEAPQLYKKNGYYYLLIAAGGTGYGHGVEIGRSKNIFGPYEPHPSGEPIITSSPRHLFSLGDPDAGHFEMYNPQSKLQKSGHGSLVDTPNGEWYVAHLMSRPLEGTLLNPLGRETSLQKMVWTEDDWLEMADGTNFAKEKVDVGNDVEQKSSAKDLTITGNSKYFMTPYHMQSEEWVQEKENILYIHGRDSFFSQFSPSILATRAESFHYKVKTQVEFNPIHYSQTAGLGLYYDSNNWIYLHLTYDERLNSTVVKLLEARLGVRKEYHESIVPIDQSKVEMQLNYSKGFVAFQYRLTSDSEWIDVLESIDVQYLSDEGVNGEPGEIGGFTGLFNFIGTVDSYQHSCTAKFYYYDVKHIEE